MITVTFTESGNKLSLRVEGHAGYAEHGQDIVCAAASILAYTVSAFIKEAERCGDLKTAPTIKTESGDVTISCEPTDAAYHAMQSAFHFALAGYALLKHNYPQCVSLHDLT